MPPGSDSSTAVEPSRRSRRRKRCGGVGDLPCDAIEQRVRCALATVVRCVLRPNSHPENRKRTCARRGGWCRGGWWTVAGGGGRNVRGDSGGVFPPTSVSVSTPVHEGTTRHGPSVVSWSDGKPSSSPATPASRRGRGQRRSPKPERPAPKNKHEHESSGPGDAANPSPGFRAGVGGSSASSRSARCSSRVCGRATTARRSPTPSSSPRSRTATSRRSRSTRAPARSRANSPTATTFNTTGGGEAGLFEGDQEFLEDNGVDHLVQGARATTSC